MAVSLTVASEYAPFPKQIEFHRSPKRFKVAAAGNRGGKTVSGAVEFIANIYRDLKLGRGKRPARIGSARVPRLLYWVVTPIHSMAEFPFNELIRYLQCHQKNCSHPRHPYEAFEGVPNASTYSFWLRGDIRVDFKSAERPERLVAASLNGVWMDEACRCKAEAWRSALRARLADQTGWAIFTTSPFGGKNNWVYQELVSKQGIDEHIAAFQWRTDENPHIPRAEVEHAKRTLPDAWYKRDWEASWDSFGGAVYPEFRDELHVITPEQFARDYNSGRAPTLADFRRIFQNIVAGMDFGFTSPGAIVVVGHLGGNRFIVLEESYHVGKRLTGVGETWLSECRRLQAKYGINVFSCDPADPEAAADLSVNGIPTVPAFNSIYMGIRRVAEALHPEDGRPGMRIMSTCTNLIAEKRAYLWKSTRDGGGFTDVPADGQSDHALDAERYGIVELRPYAQMGQAQRRGNARPVG